MQIICQMAIIPSASIDLIDNIEGCKQQGLLLASTSVMGKGLTKGQLYGRH